METAADEAAERIKARRARLEAALARKAPMLSQADASPEAEVSTAKPSKSAQRVAESLAELDALKVRSRPGGRRPLRCGGAPTPARAPTALGRR